MIELRLLGGLEAEGAMHRRPLALLALVALSAPVPVLRERVMAFLWPESDSARAGNSLRQTIFRLRRELGDDVLLTDATGGIQLNPALVRVDVWSFRAAADQGRHAEAIELYGGPLLGDFPLPGGSEFGQWVEAERDRLKRQYLASLDALAAAAERAGSFDEAVEWRRRQVAGDPFSSRTALALMKSLAAAGETSGALEFAANYENLVREHLEIEPDPALTRYVDSLRDGSVSPARPGEAPQPAPPPRAERQPPVGQRTPAPAGVTSWARTHRGRVLAGAAFVAVALTGLAAHQYTGTAPARGTVVAASAGGQVSGRDPDTWLIACEGPACPPEQLPQNAWVVPQHPAWGRPIAETGYISPVRDGASGEEPGYECCTTATFESAFRLPRNAVSAIVTASMHADNQATLFINGVEFGRHSDQYSAGNYSGEAEAYRFEFVPHPSGVNRLQIKLWDGGGALAVHYHAVITYTVESGR